METGRPTTKRRPLPRGEGGYSLVELVIAVGVAVVVGLGIYAVFNYTQKSTLSQRLYNDMQTSCNFAMEQMKSELMLAGYRARDQVRPISVAGTSTVTFEYFDDNARAEAPYAVGYDNNTQVTFRFDDTNDELFRDFTRHIPAGSYDTANMTVQKLAENVAAVSFAYFKEDNQAWTYKTQATHAGDPELLDSNGAAKPDNLDLIRVIRPTLTCNASRQDPNTGRTPQITLTTEVRARNIDVAGVATDVTPPGAPDNLIAWDKGECGTLYLRWDANGESDLAGYTLYYGLAHATYTERVVLSGVPGGTSGYVYYTVTGLDSSVTGVSPPPTYYFAVAAYDKSGNVSTSLSPEASGDSGADSAAAAVSSGSDTTITPAVPEAVTLTATQGTGSGITLTWNKSAAPELKGYRLYRSETSAAFTPDDATNLIADETTLGKDRVDYADNAVMGCTTYYYKLAATSCDTGLPTSSLVFASANGYANEETAPKAPTLAARPGYKRIILTLTNPATSGDDGTPDFVYTKIYYSDSRTAGATYPSLVPVPSPPLGSPRQVVDPGTGSPIPDNDVGNFATTPNNDWGRFTGTTTKSINFNNFTDPAPSNTFPALVPCKNADWETSGTCDTLTYYFTAVAYDRCGNPSNVTAASITKADQCNDGISPDPTYGAPTWSGVIGQYAYPDVAHIKSEGCFDYINLTWDEISSDVIDDLAGYHVYRCDDQTTCASGGTELTAGDPIWYPQFQDQVANGTTYSYRIEATDCFYERRVAGSENNYSHDSINALSVGGFAEDPSLPDAVTGYLLGSTPARPFTVSAADGLTSVPPTFRHNTVTVWADNRAASAVTLQQLSSSWVNTSAYLQQFAFGDGSTTPVTIGWEDSVTPLTSASTGTTVPLSPTSQVLAGDLRIPLVQLFRNSDGSVTRETDQREQWLEYTLTYRNESTATAGCGFTGSVYVPLGPYAYSVGQDQPSAGTRSWPVPGDQGSNAMNAVVVPGGQKVRVFANVYDAAGAGLSSVRLYYYVDASRLLTAAPALAATAQYPNLPPYTAVTMTPVAGNLWSTPTAPTDSRLPAADGSNVWFFLVAVDNDGNFDREPEVGSGAFQYYQPPADPCSTIPNPPTLAGSNTTTDVTLTWTAPANNQSGSPYTDGKGFKVYRQQDAGAWTLVQTINDKDTLTWTDAGVAGIGASTYRYYVTAFDTCLPTAKESNPSGIFTELYESPCGSTPDAPALSGTTDGAGGSVALTWTAPTTNTSGTPLTDLAGYEIWRRVTTPFDPGTWTLLATVGAGTTTYTDSAANLQADDYQYYVKAYDTCSPPLKSTASNVYVDEYVLNPCDTTPGVPTDLTVTAANGTVGVSLSWSAPTSQAIPVGVPYNDPGGFYLYRYEMPGYLNGVWLPSAAVPLPPSQTTYTDSTVTATVGSTQYAYWVQAVDDCGIRSSWVGPVYEGYSDPCLTAPNPPVGLAVSAADDTGVTLQWTAPGSSDVAGYEIERAESSAGPWAEISSSPVYGGTTIVKDLVTDAGAKAYFYRVRTFNSCATPNYSTYAGPVPETYLNPCLSIPAVPASPAVAVSSVTSANCSNKNTDLSVTWSGAAPFSNATSTLFYRIFRCPTGNTESAPAGCTNQVYPATESPLPVQTDLTEMISTGGVAPNNSRLWIWVEAVSARSGCDPSHWKSVMSSPVKDACGP